MTETTTSTERPTTGANAPARAEAGGAIAGAIHARTALLCDGWHDDVRLTIRDGRFVSVEAGPAQDGDQHADILLPGMANLHSHAFQRAMAGLAEIRGPSRDTFWTWREIMYRVALTLDPVEVDVIAAQLYAEMLEAGFTRVGEFHYLHHAPDGRPYDSVAEMAAAVAGAAETSGIALTLIPVLYANGNFGGAPAHAGQRRFLCDPAGFERLVDASAQVVAGLAHADLGVAAHSLRAATPQEMAFAAGLRPERPFHMHIAEQVKEVEDCLAWSGQRPVEWLLDHADALGCPIDERWCLIHATHMDDAETRRLAETGAVAGLCPITEANLGDGIFPGPAFAAAGGRFGIGTDSNVLVDVAGELRQFEYAQRLGRRERNVMAAASAGSTGRALFGAAVAGGARALGSGPAGLAVGAAADCVSLDAAHPALVGRSGDGILDGFLFAASRPAIDAVWVAGRRLVTDGRHVDRERIVTRFSATMHDLAGRL